MLLVLYFALKFTNRLGVSEAETKVFSLLKFLPLPLWILVHQILGNQFKHSGELLRLEFLRLPPLITLPHSSLYVLTKTKIQH